MHFCILSVVFLCGLHPLQDSEPTAQSLIARQEKEKAPVWVDGDTATFFYQGEAEQVQLLIGGEIRMLRRLPDSDVWTTTVKREGMRKGVFSYTFYPGKKGESIGSSGRRGKPTAWRGPEAPPAPTKVEKLAGKMETVSFTSKALGETRSVLVYLPPGHDKTKSYPVVYATDGINAAHLCESLIAAGKAPPLILVAASCGTYQGDRSKPYDVKNDRRAVEYLAGIDAEQYRKHETFFRDELSAWAEKEFGASRRKQDRAVLGCSNGARFAVSMGMAHPDFYGHVFAFSVAGRRDTKLPEGKQNLPYFHLAAGTWEPAFLRNTSLLAETLKKENIPHIFISRVAGHDFAMWEDELAAATVRAFGSRAKKGAD